MKPTLRKAFTLLLCLSLCLLLAPAALAEDAQSQPADASGQELFPVRFYNEKGYDLIGLQVTDAVGHALDPSSREDGWTYLLAPGAYSYTYHDDRGIFLDLDKTGFTVDGAAEIPLTLRAFLTENANFTVFVNPFYQDTLDEDTIAWHEEALSEELERVVERLAAGEEASGLSQSDVFYGSENEIEGYAETLRTALIAREPSVSLTVYSGNTRWSADDYTSVLIEVFQKAFQHTGNQQEGDTLRWEVYSYGYGGGTYNNYDYNKQSYYHVIPYSFTYQSSAAQESEEESSSYPAIDMTDIVSTTESSYLKESDLHYPASSTIDGDPATGWSEDVSGYGEGEWIVLSFDGTYIISGLRIATGLQTDSDRYFNNARPRQILLTFSDGSEITADLEDRMGYQNIEFEQPVASNNLKVTISAVYRGSKYEDTLISEIELY